MKKLLMGALAMSMLAGCGAPAMTTQLSPAAMTSSTMKQSAASEIPSKVKAGIEAALKALPRVKKVVKVDIKPVEGKLYAFQAVIKELEPSSMFWPQYYDRDVAGTYDASTGDVVLK